MKFLEYELIQKCGSGSYGEVYVARNRAGGRVALKRIEDPERISGEFAGLRSSSRIPDFRHLIRIFHVGEFGNTLYYTMELADNLGSGERYIPSTLANVLQRKGRFSPAETVALGRKLLQGVSVLHRAGLIHRDIKPENILFVGGEPKLSDIGLLRSVSQSLSAGGTIGFIPPEKLAGSFPERNPSDDLYALGKVLYCCLTGNRAEDWPAFPGSLVSRECRELNQVLLAACAKSRIQRFRKAEEMEQALISGIPRGKRALSLLLKFRFYFLGGLLCAGIFLSGALFPLPRRLVPLEPAVSEESAVSEEPALRLGEIANRVPLEFSVSDGEDELVAPTFEDPVYRTYSPFALDGASREEKELFSERFERWSNWETENSDGFRIFRNVLSIGNAGTIFLKRPLENPYAIRFELACSGFSGRMDFRVSAQDRKKRERSYYQCSLQSSDSENLTLLPLEYQPENGRKITILPVRQPETRRGFHTVELVQTEQFFRFYMDGELLAHAPSFFFGGTFGIGADRVSARESVYLRKFQLFRIASTPGCPEERQYRLPDERGEEPDGADGSGDPVSGYGEWEGRSPFNAWKSAFRSPSGGS